MENEFLFKFHEIQNEDQRFVIQTLFIDILNDLIHHRFNSKYQILPLKFINEFFLEHQSAMNCLQSIGFQQVCLFFFLFEKRKIFSLFDFY